MKAGRERKRRARMPPDAEVREVLVESGMPAAEADRRLSQLRRVARLEFFGRRRNRLLSSV